MSVRSLHRSPLRGIGTTVATTATVAALIFGSGIVSASAEPATLTGVVLTGNIETVYPVRDGYRDAIMFTLSPAKGSTAGVRYTGSVVITQGTKVIKSIPYSGTKASRVTWDGRVGTKAVTGVYVATATMTEGSTTVKSAGGRVIVSRKALHKRTRIVKKTASAFFSTKHDNAFSETTTGTAGCALVKTALRCTSKEDGYITRTGFLSTPLNIVASSQFRNFTAHQTYTVTKQTRGKFGGAVFHWGTEQREVESASLKKGTNKTMSDSFQLGDGRLMLSTIVVGGADTLHITSVKTSYTYYVLK